MGQRADELSPFIQTERRSCKADRTRFALYLAQRVMALILTEPTTPDHTALEQEMPSLTAA
jgi:hypothetical protein